MATQAAPRAKARAAKTEAPPPAAEVQVRQAAREPARDIRVSGYYDREGNPIVRKNPGYRNEFDFKPGEVPEGWEYQWIRHTVHGDPSESELWDMQENGWRPVPHTRHPGRFGPGELFKGDLDKGSPACIIRKGQLLVERPTAMCDEARAEQKRDADGLIRDQFRQFSVPLPDNVQRMGLTPHRGVARQEQAADAMQVKADYQPKHELAIE